MRGVFVKAPLEFKLEVQGDEWRQGESLNCNLCVKNRGDASCILRDFFLHLAKGDIKRVREKSSNAFEIIASAGTSPITQLQPAEEQTISCKFELDKNCLISDKKSSLFLLCGSGSINDIYGQLALNILPHSHIEALLTLLENSFSFSLKSQKTAKDWLEAKLKPPAGKNFPTLEQLVLYFHFSEAILQLKYSFHLKTLQATANSLEIGKSKRELVQELKESDYLFPTGQVNIEALEPVIAQALSAVKARN